MFATSLDLNMGYYHILLSQDSSKLCTFVTPWGKYEYLRLPMGLCNSPDIFQEKMSELMQGLELVKVYIDDLLTISKGTFEDHLDKLEQVFHRLSTAGLKINAKKSFFAKPELEYLGYWITWEGIQPIPKKVDAILNIAPPTTRKQLRRFIGLINFYRDMWIHRSDLLSPLTALTSKSIPFKWTDIEQKAFEMIKKVISREVLLTYPDFSKEFHIYTDASKVQLGAVISQDSKPIAFYSRKLSPAQKNYTTSERELLSIVETLKEFRNILLGHKIIVHTDHMNLIHKNSNIEQITRWRLLIEEYGPTLHYVKGENNVVADALSRLDISSVIHSHMTTEELLETFGLDEADLPLTAFPLTFLNITKAQNACPELFTKLHLDPKYHLFTFCGGGKTHELICRDGKNVIPPSLQSRLVQWYHVQLCHPGETRTEHTIRQHFWWPGLRNSVHSLCSKCPTCQKNKKSTKKYGHLPEKEAEAEPWDKLCVDLIGPYTIKRNQQPPLKLWCVTMIDPATGWFEI